MTVPPDPFLGPFRALGYRFRVRTDVPSTESVIERLFAPLREGSADGVDATYELTIREGAPRRYELLRDGVSIQVVSNPGSMLDWIVADMARRSLTSDGELVAVHAGVVAKGGRAILLPAPPDHGKTTLVAGLVLAGFEFLSDEAAPIDPETLRVRPFPRPLVISPRTMALLPGLEASLPDPHGLLRNLNHHVSPEDLRPGSLGGEARIDHVVAPTYIPGSRTTLEPLSRAETLALLVDQCFNLDRLGRSAIRVLGEVVRNAACHRLTIGDLPAAVAEVRRLFDR